MNAKYCGGVYGIVRKEELRFPQENSVFLNSFIQLICEMENGISWS